MGMLVQEMGPTALSQEDKTLSQARGSWEREGPGGGPGCSGCPPQKLRLDLSKKDLMSQLSGKTGDLALKQAGSKELVGVGREEELWKWPRGRVPRPVHPDNCSGCPLSWAQPWSPTGATRAQLAPPAPGEVPSPGETGIVGPTV